MKSMPHEQLTINNFIFALVKLPFCEEYGGIAQLGACKIKSMPPLSNHKSTIKYYTPQKLP